MKRSLVCRVEENDGWSRGLGDGGICGVMKMYE
jgi:hypothetical protein